MGQPVAIRGMGAVTALGVGLEPIAASLRSGADGLGPVHRFDTRPFSTSIGGMVSARNRRDYAGGGAAAALAPEFAEMAIAEMFENAGVSPAQLASVRTVLLMGASQVDSKVPVHEMVVDTLRRLGLAAPGLSVSTACSSSAAALALGVALIRLGHADFVVAGGADVLVPELFGGFDNLGLLTRDKCTPFGPRLGTTLGEGAAFCLLGRATGTGPELLGYGLSNDAWHETSPHPRGEGLALALQACLASAGIDPDEVDYVNAHGTGTEANDPAELRAVQAALGRLPPLSSTKSAVGHAQAAAGAIELVATVLGLQGGQFPPSLRAQPRRPGIEAPIVDVPTRGTLGVALSNSAAFSGSNAVLAVSRDARPRTGAEPHPVYWLGAAACGRHGSALPAFFAAIDESRALPPLPSLPSLVGLRIDPRSLDPAGHFVVRAVADALASAGVRIARANRDRVGIVGGAVLPSPTTHAEFDDSIAKFGAARASVSAFARMVLNAPAGAAARALDLRGAHTQVSVGPGTGLATLLVAALLLADDGPTHTIVASCVDEAAPGGACGAAAAVLARAPSPVRLAGLALASTAAEAERQALERAGLGAVACRFAPGCGPSLAPLGSGPAVDGIHRAMLAAREVEGGAGSALVVESGPLGALALVFCREAP